MHVFCVLEVQESKSSLLSLPSSNFFSIGNNVRTLLERSDGLYCFRLHNARVYYVKEEIMKFAATIPAEKLVCLGVCFGKITKGGKFMLHITALGFLHPYCQVVYILFYVAS